MPHSKMAERNCKKKSDVKLTFTVAPKILKVFDEKRKEREEPNRSTLLEFLMVCYIYGYDDNCKECPFYEEPNNKEEAETEEEG